MIMTDLESATIWKFVCRSCFYWYVTVSVVEGFEMDFRREFGKSYGKRWKPKIFRTNIEINPTDVSASRLADDCPRRVVTTE